MRLKALFLALCLFFISQKLPAFFCCDDWGNIDVEVEWLYFRPAVDNSFLFSVSSGGFASETLRVVPPYHSGWRVGAAYQLCNCEDSFAIRWSQLRTSDTRHYNSSSVLATPTQQFTGLGGNVFAREKFDFNFYALDALLNHRLLYQPQLCIDCSAGIQYAWIGVKDRIDLNAALTTTRGFAKANSHFWGIGPELGVDFLYAIWGNFSLAGKATSALLISRSKGRVKGTFSAAGAVETIKNDPFWRLVPSFDIRLGFRYDACYCWANVYLEAGYEALSYVRGLTLNVAQSSVFEQSDADMHGPYIALGCIF